MAEAYGMFWPKGNGHARGKPAWSSVITLHNNRV
jgi:hypothetical protein